MEIVKEIELRHGGGGGFGKRDDSPDLEKQNYAEKLILSKVMLEAMASLEVAYKTSDGNWAGKSILLSKIDIPEYFKDGNEGMNGACHEINKVFVAAGFPMYATSWATDSAERTVVTRKRGKHVGKTVKTVIADRIRIYRITQDFDINKYACNDSSKVIVEGINPYHQYTEGVYLRTQKVLKQFVSQDEMKDVLLKLGYS